MNQSALLQLLGPVSDGLGAALDTRANIIAATQAAEDAVLIPNETGAWSHDMRHALAARIARLHGETDAATHYSAKVHDPKLAPLADSTQDGAAQDMAVVCAFVDRVSAHTRDVNPSDILALQQGGVADADIVRLCELSAFLSYQLRVLAGMRLMGAST